MSKLGRGFGSRFMESYFKRTPDGWLFAAPYLWPRRTYLVTDEQKATLVGQLLRLWWTQTALSIVAIIVLLNLLQDRPILMWIAIGIVFFAAFILSYVYAAVAIRPLLVGLHTTNERITFSDRFKARAVALPKVFFVVGSLFSLLMFAVGIIVGLLDTWDWQVTLSTVFFGALTLLYVAYFFARQQAKPQT